MKATPLGRFLASAVAAAAMVLGVACPGPPGIIDDAGLDNTPDAAPDAAPPRASTWAWDIWGSEGRQYANAVAEAEDGGAYVGGYRDTRGGWIARISPDGDALWERVIGSWVSGVAAHAEGGVVVAGHGPGGAVGLVAHVDADGTPQWRLAWDTNADYPQSVQAVAATPEGTFVVAARLPRSGEEKMFGTDILVPEVPSLFG